MKANFNTILSSVLQSINRRVIRGIEDNKELSLLSALNYYDNLLACNNCGQEERNHIQNLIQDIKYQCPEICNFSTRIVNTQSQKPNLPPQSDDVLLRFKLPAKYDKTLFVLPYEKVIFNYYDPDGDTSDGFKITNIGNSQWLYIGDNEVLVDTYVAKNNELKGGFNTPYRIIHGDIPHIGIFQEEKFKELYSTYKPRTYHFNNQCDNIENKVEPLLNKCPIEPKPSCQNKFDNSSDKNYIEFSKLKEDKSGFEHVRLEFDDLCCKAISEFKIKVKDKNWYKDLYSDKEATITTEYVASWENLPNCCNTNKPLVYYPQLNYSPKIEDNYITIKIVSGLNNNKQNLPEYVLVNNYFDKNGDGYSKVITKSLKFDNTSENHLFEKSNLRKNGYNIFWFKDDYVFFDYESNSVILVNNLPKDWIFFEKKEDKLIFQKLNNLKNEFIFLQLDYKQYKEEEITETIKVRVQDDSIVYPMWSNVATISIKGVLPKKANVCTNDKRKKLIFVK